jgi:hypothetical protein
LRQRWQRPAPAAQFPGRCAILSPLVKLVRKRLDEAGLAAHFAWLAAEAKAIEIRVKGAPTAYSEAATSLDDTARRLAAGELLAVQVQYFHDDCWWSDTLLRAKDGYRLVRMRQESPPLSP